MAVRASSQNRPDPTFQAVSAPDIMTVMQFSAPRDVSVTWDGTEGRGKLGRWVFVIAVCVCSGSCVAAPSVFSSLFTVTADAKHARAPGRRMS